MNKPGSGKETWHIDIDLPAPISIMPSAIRFGIFPANDPALVDGVIEALGAPPDFPIGDRTLKEVLTDGVSLSPAPDMLFQLISYVTGGERGERPRRLATARTPMAMRHARRAGGFAQISRHCASTRKPSSRRSIRCSRASIRSPRR